MSRWYRVFGSLDAVIDLGAETPFCVQCFSADEEGIRAELDSWAAFLETCAGPHAVPLMERVIQTRRLFTFHDPTGELESEGVDLCRLLAGYMAGFYQIDDLGFFDADGTLLVAEESIS